MQRQSRRSNNHAPGAEHRFESIASAEQSLAISADAIIITIGSDCCAATQPRSRGRSSRSARSSPACSRYRPMAGGSRRRDHRAERAEAGQTARRTSCLAWTSSGAILASFASRCDRMRITNPRH
jgi:hypothetical protein